MLGLILFLFHWIFNSFLPIGVGAVLTVGLWIFLTGGLHLDGWTDCCDAMGAAVSQERRAIILKDSRLGSFGAMGLFLILGTKVACLCAGPIGLSGFLLAGVAGRGLMTLASKNCFFIKPGMAQLFIAGVDSKTYYITWILTILFAIVAGVAGMLSLLVAYVGALCFRKFAENRLGFVNGDVMGATCELSEAIVLVALCWRWGN